MASRTSRPVDPNASTRSLANQSRASVSSITSTAQNFANVEHLVPVERCLQELLSIFSQKPFSNPPSSARGEVVDGADLPLRDYCESIDYAWCVKIVEYLGDNVKKIWEAQARYLVALEELLQDACEPEDRGGLEEDDLNKIYAKLDQYYCDAYETRLRMKLAHKLQTSLKEHDLAAKQNDSEWTDKVPDIPDCFREMVRKKLTSLRKELPAMHVRRQRKWKALLAKRKTRNDDGDTLDHAAATDDDDAEDELNVKTYLRDDDDDDGEEEDLAIDLISEDESVASDGKIAGTRNRDIVIEDSD